ncbi:unnamed protein product, partial [marine sediment metagenome]
HPLYSSLDHTEAYYHSFILTCPPRIGPVIMLD